MRREHVNGVVVRHKNGYKNLVIAKAQSFAGKRDISPV